MSDVYSVEEINVKLPPDFGDRVNTKFVKGLATVNEKMVVLLEIDELLHDQWVENALEKDD